MLKSFKPRQEVFFDIKNKNHRKHFFNFISQNKWDKDAPLFALEDGWLQVPEMIKHKLALHYLNKEFNK